MRQYAKFFCFVFPPVFFRLFSFLLYMTHDESCKDQFITELRIIFFSLCIIVAILIFALCFMLSVYFVRGGREVSCALRDPDVFSTL